MARTRWWARALMCASMAVAAAGCGRDGAGSERRQSALTGVSWTVVGPDQKVRPQDRPAGASTATLKAGRNEVEAFQIVLTGGSTDLTGVSAQLGQAPTGSAGTIPASDVTLYRVDYYQASSVSASTPTSQAGLWPDPLIPDVDTYVGERRNAFPFTVPAGQSRVIWVDVLVPQGATPGDYAGRIDLMVGGSVVANVPVALHVGNFTLPSTPTLKSAFDMGWSDPCRAHYPSDTSGYCGGSETTATALRALYIRAALDHRLTISRVDFQPPFGSSQAPFEANLLPLINGTAPTRLPGARVTTVYLDGGASNLSSWVSYAKSKGFFSRLLWYPVDEPGSNAGAWQTFVNDAAQLHAIDQTARILITGTIDDANSYGATNSVDVFVPIVNFLDGTRGEYDSWLTGAPGREVWTYQSCMSYGCGGTPGSNTASPRWPSLMIDASAVENRAMGWQAFLLGATAQLYYDTTYQLSTAWNADGQYAFGGAGDGTLFYPGLPSRIGGTTHIPIESIRMKLLREGVEDYEYLALASQIDAARARSIAATLFPSASQSNQTAAALESARDQLFAMLDGGSTGGCSAGGVTWTDVTNCTVNGSSLQKTGGETWAEDAGAVSAQTLNGDGSVSFTIAETDAFRFFGLSRSSTWGGAAGMDFSFRMQAGHGDVYENNVWTADNLIQTGDVLTIAVTSGIVRYYKNGQLLYTSTHAPVFPMTVQASFIDLGGTVQNAQITGTVGGSCGGGTTSSGGGTCTGPFAAGAWPPACWRPYAASSPFNTPLPANPRLLSNSPQIVARILDTSDLIQSGSTRNPYVSNFIAPQNGTGGWPTYYPRSTDPYFTIHCQQPWGTCAVEGLSVQIPANAEIQGGPSAPADSDRHLTVVDFASGWEYDFWQVATPRAPATGGEYDIGWGGRTRIDGDGLGSDATASQMGNLAGRIRAEELAAGKIDHALSITMNCDAGTFVYPATKSDRACAALGRSNTNAPPMGARLQLAMSAADIDALPVPGWKKTILHAAATYGMYVNDTGSSFYFDFQTEAGNQYLSQGAADAWYAFAQQNAWSPYDDPDYGPTLVGQMHGDGIDWTNQVWSHLQVVDPCVTQGACP